MTSEDIKFEILHDHYKDTFVRIQDFLKLRDRFFFLILILVTLMLFQIYSPTESGETISEFVAKQLELKNPIDISFLGSILWFGLLGLVIRYFQTVVHLEKLYEYIHKLEEQISPNYDNKAFTREGKFYLNDYPLFSTWTSILYTIIFPVLLLIVVFSKIIGELSHSEHVSFILLFNIGVFLCILISTIFYLLLVHFRK
jgi:hypothetical protein